MMLRKYIKWCFLLVLPFWFCFQVKAQAQEPSFVNNNGLDPGQSKKIEDLVKEGMKKWHSPGLAVGIVKDGKLAWTGYFGYADLKNKKAVSKNSEFLIGSISKTFTALALMQQMEKGRFHLEDAVNPYGPYPVYRTAKTGCREATFLDVFTHTSGAGELMSWRQLGKLIPTTLVLKGQDRPLLRKIYNDGIRPHICPGTKYAYCNFCFGALGLLLEQMSGEAFAAYQDAHILEPLGMSSSHFYETDTILQNLAKGYTSSGQKFSELHFMRYPVTPMGGLYSTVNDMSRYILMLLNQGQLGDAVLVKPETIEVMFTPHYQVDPRLMKIGLCFFIHENYFGHKIIEHDGAMPGYGAQLFIAPDDHLGIIVFANIMNDSAYEIGYGLLKILFQKEAPPENFEERKDLWPTLVGSYGSPEPDLLSDFRFFMRSLGIYRIRVKNNQLWLESMRLNQKFRLKQVSKDDPYFFEIIKSESQIPRHLVFKPGTKAQTQSLMIGLNEYLRLKGEAKTKAYTKAILAAGLPDIY